ncbi:MAG: hypothetical protein HGA95_02205 [Caldiserica bacterium]|nr:hypothetical protein [Caldisericota bacterium]
MSNASKILPNIPLNHVFFEVHGFSGNKTDIHLPQNSYINNILKKNNVIINLLLFIQKSSLPRLNKYYQG